MWLKKKVYKQHVAICVLNRGNEGVISQLQSAKKTHS